MRLNKTVNKTMVLMMLIALSSAVAEFYIIWDVCGGGR